MNKHVLNFTGSVPKAADGGSERKLTVVISTSNPDRSNDVVNPKGVVLDNYIKNPIVLWAHNYKQPQIGRAENIQIKDDRIIATVVFPKEGIYDLADLIYNLSKEGIHNTWSIGLVPKEYEPNELGGYNFNKWELLEFSAVPVPDNPEALTVLRSKGLSENTIAQLTTPPTIEAEEEKAEEKDGEAAEETSPKLKNLNRLVENSPQMDWSKKTKQQRRLMSRKQKK